MTASSRNPSPPARPRSPTRRTAIIGPQGWCAPTRARSASPSPPARRASFGHEGEGDAFTAYGGGLVGENAYKAMIMDSYSTAPVDAKGSNSIGGLVGESTGSIFSTYASGAVTNFMKFGGVMGEFLQGNQIDGRTYWDTDSTASPIFRRPPATSPTWPAARASRRRSCRRDCPPASIRRSGARTPPSMAACPTCSPIPAIGACNETWHRNRLRACGPGRVFGAGRRRGLQRPRPGT